MLPAFCFPLRLTFSVFTIDGEEKERNSIGPLTNIKIIFLIWTSKYKYSIKKKFIYSYLLILSQHTWKCKRKCILCQFWNTLILDQNLEVLLSIFYGTKITLEWITTPISALPPFLYLPPLCLTYPLLLNFFQPSIPPICNQGVPTMDKAHMGAIYHIPTEQLLVL